MILVIEAVKLALQSGDHLDDHGLSEIGICGSLHGQFALFPHDFSGPAGSGSMEAVP